MVDEEAYGIALPVLRGCGKRHAGGIYAEVGLSPFGDPLERFLVEGLVLPEGVSITPLGVTLLEVNGVWHVVDWVGSESYPNVADFVEEVRRFGMSRRLPHSLDFSKLTDRSMHILVHARAKVENAADYGAPLVCPKGTVHAPGEFCCGTWWNDVEGGETVKESSTGQVVKRTVGSTTYTATRRPDGVTPQYTPAIFAMLPLSRLVVIDGTEDVGEKYKSIARSGLPTAVVPE